jgi:hypothetical protein
MKHRYVFPVWAGIPGLDAYSVLESRIWSLRLLVPSSGSYGYHLLAIIGVAFGYLGALVLIDSSPFYQQAAPWRIPGFSPAIVLAIVGRVLRGADMGGTLCSQLDNTAHITPSTQIQTGSTVNAPT